MRLLHRPRDRLPEQHQETRERDGEKEAQVAAGDPGEVERGVREAKLGDRHADLPRGMEDEACRLVGKRVLMREGLVGMPLPGDCRRYLLGEPHELAVERLQSTGGAPPRAPPPEPLEPIVLTDLTMVRLVVH